MKTQRLFLYYQEILRLTCLTKAEKLHKDDQTLNCESLSHNVKKKILNNDSARLQLSTQHQSHDKQESYCPTCGIMGNKVHSHSTSSLGGEAKRKTGSKRKQCYESDFRARSGLRQGAEDE